MNLLWLAWRRGAGFDLPPEISTTLIGYVANGNMLYLMADAATAWLGPVTLGSAATLENSQCRVNGPASTASTAQSILTVTVEVTFKPAYAGSKNVYLAVQDVNGVVAGWLRVGTWKAI